MTGIHLVSLGSIRNEAMKSPGALFLGTLFLCLCASTAQAQNYLPSDGGFYWSVRGGLSQVRNLAIWDHGGYDPVYDNATPPNLLIPGLNDHREFRSLEMDYGFVVGASIGYTMAYPDRAADLRFEAEAIYRRNENGEINSDWFATSDRPDSVSLGFETVPVVGSMEVRSAMFNVLVDFHTGTRFTPYLGLGGGMSQLVTDGYTLDGNRAAVGFGYPQFFSDNIYALSWQAIGGIGYRLSPGVMLTMEARYFRLGADRWSDMFQTEELRDIKFEDWSMGLRFTF